jgi:hypothetical protein
MDKARWAAYMRRYRKRPEVRARYKGGVWAAQAFNQARTRSRSTVTITVDWVLAEFDRLGRRCPCCGVDMRPGEGLRTAPSIEHLHGLDHPLTPETARIICGECNSIKNACLDPAELHAIATFYDRPVDAILDDARANAALHPMPRRVELPKASHRDRCRYLLWVKMWGARDHGIPFALTIDDIAWPSCCPVLGVPLLLPLSAERTRRIAETGAHANTAFPDSPSFDRIDPALGYVPGNVLIASRHANVLKQDAAPTRIRLVAEWFERESATRRQHSK